MTSGGNNFSYFPENQLNPKFSRLSWGSILRGLLSQRPQWGINRQKI